MNGVRGTAGSAGLSGTAGSAGLSGTAGPGGLIGRRAARRLARQELARLARLPLWDRILRDIERLFSGGQNAIPRGWFGLIVFAVLVAVLIVVLLTWARPGAERRARGAGVLGGKARNAAEYRAEAERLAAEGDYGAAIVERVRAIAAELDERGILLARAGRTANEIAGEAGAALPELASALRAAAWLFDDIRYGGLPGTLTAYEQVSDIDAQVRTARQATLAVS
ncbi:MAG TPA: DUF4129 domain-containing protein [Streptosporangiaceae bacterium]|nr:DUF4129 domain-containing protein [Streptosporangiaceae bacterium]